MISEKYATLRHLKKLTNVNFENLQLSFADLVIF